MAKNVYIGVNGKSHKVKKIYFGVSNKARKIKKGYIGVGGKARLFFSGDDDRVSVDSNLISLYTPTAMKGAGIIGNHAVFAGGCTNELPANNFSITDAESFDTSLTHQKLTNVTKREFQTLSANINNNIILFSGNNGGYYEEAYNPTIDVFKSDLTKTSLTISLESSNLTLNSSIGNSQYGYVMYNDDITGGNIYCLSYNESLTMTKNKLLEGGVSFLGGMASLNNETVIAGGHLKGSVNANKSNLNTYKLSGNNTLTKFDDIMSDVSETKESPYIPSGYTKNHVVFLPHNLDYIYTYTSSGVKTKIACTYHKSTGSVGIKQVASTSQGILYWMLGYSNYLKINDSLTLSYPSKISSGSKYYVTGVGIKNLALFAGGLDANYKSTNEVEAFVVE